MSSNHTNDIAPIHEGMIGGSIPLAEKMNPDQTVRLIAQDVLETTSIHYITSTQDGHIFYLAVPSRLLTSAAEFASPIAASLPGGVNDKGDGVYFYPILGYAAALIRHGSSMRYLYGFSTDVRESFANEELSVFELDESSPSEHMRSESWVYRAMSTKADSFVNRASLAMLTLSMLTLLATKGIAGYYAGTSGTPMETVVAEAQKVVRTTQTASPLAEQLSRLTKIADVTVRSGGWIEGYQYDTSKGERFVLAMPSWTTQETITSLGGGVSAELNQDGDGIWVVKKDKSGLTIPGKGPSEIPVTNDAR